MDKSNVNHPEPTIKVTEILADAARAEHGNAAAVAKLREELDALSPQDLRRAVESMHKACRDSAIVRTLSPEDQFFDKIGLAIGGAASDALLLTPHINVETDNLGNILAIDFAPGLNCQGQHNVRVEMNSAKQKEFSEAPQDKRSHNV